MLGYEGKELCGVDGIIQLCDKPEASHERGVQARRQRSFHMFNMFWVQEFKKAHMLQPSLSLSVIIEGGFLIVLSLLCCT